MDFSINQTCSILYDSKLNYNDIKKLFLNNNINFDIDIPENSGQPFTLTITSPVLKIAKINNGIINVSNTNRNNVSSGTVQVIFQNSKNENSLQSNMLEFLTYIDIFNKLKNVLYYEIHLSGLISQKYTRFKKFNIDIKSINNPRSFGFKIFDGDMDGNVINGPVKMIAVEPYVSDASKTYIDMVYRSPNVIDKEFFSIITGDLKYIINNLIGDK